MLPEAVTAKAMWLPSGDQTGENTPHPPAAPHGTATGVAWPVTALRITSAGDTAFGPEAPNSVDIVCFPSGEIATEAK